MAGGIGDRFQQETKYDPRRMPVGGLDRQGRPGLYKEYAASRKIDLAHPRRLGEVSIDRALRARKSVRRFSQRLLSVDQLSYLLWASTGIQREEAGYAFRTAPSAGALYPIETYCVVNRVEEIPQGVYHYSIRSHLLEEMRRGEHGAATAGAALGQDMCRESAAVFIWTAIFQRSKWKYGQRAYRYVYLDAGHIAQNLALAAAGLGLGSCQIAALFDDEVNHIIGVDGVEESTIYMTVAGYPLASETGGR